MFGGRVFEGGCRARVAVVSTDTAVKHGPVVLANYNRPQEEAIMGRSNWSPLKVLGFNMSFPSILRVHPRGNA